MSVRRPSESEYVAKFTDTDTWYRVRPKKRGDDAPITRQQVRDLQNRYINAIRGTNIGGSRDLVHIAQDVQAITDLCIGDLSEQLLSSCIEQSDLLLQLRKGYARVFSDYRTAHLLLQQRISSLNEAYKGEQEAHQQSCDDGMAIVKQLTAEKNSLNEKYRRQLEELERQRVQEVTAAYSEMKATEEKYHALHQLFQGLQQDDSIAQLKAAKEEIARLKKQIEGTEMKVESLEGEVAELKAAVKTAERDVELKKREIALMKNSMRAEKERRSLCAVCSRRIEIESAETAQILLSRQARHEAALKELSSELRLAPEAAEAELSDWVSPKTDDSDAIALDMKDFAHRVAVTAVQIKSLPALASMYQENTALKARVDELAGAGDALAEQKARYSDVLRRCDELEAQLAEVQQDGAASVPLLTSRSTRPNDGDGDGGRDGEADGAEPEPVLSNAQLKALAMQQLPPAPTGLDLVSFPPARGPVPSLEWTVGKIRQILQSRAMDGLRHGSFSLVGDEAKLLGHLSDMGMYIYYWGLRVYGTRAKTDAFIHKLRLGLKEHALVLEVGLFSRTIARVDRALFVMSAHLIAHGSFTLPATKEYVITMDGAVECLAALAGVGQNGAIAIATMIWDVATGADLVSEEGDVPTAFFLGRILRMYDAEVDKKLSTLKVLVNRPPVMPSTHPSQAFATVMSAVFPDAPDDAITALYAAAVALGGPNPPYPIISRCIKQSGFLARVSRPVPVVLMPSLHSLGRKKVTARVVSAVYSDLRGQLARPGLQHLAEVDPSWPSRRDGALAAIEQLVTDKNRFTIAIGYILKLQHEFSELALVSWGVRGLEPAVPALTTAQCMEALMMSGLGLMAALIDPISVDERVSKKKGKKGKKAKKGKK
ncbi:chromosome segregation protein [Carpediemonas membranifera]|uniref:Chromosome segregation protein n=1 Tax=Carpediemonas membranifera TaxID=201153 RepID=A0A8J6ASJ6_9EUKA|nr:chromosome segregation protein [Carpediemonas membranifera]|eukprot:KAG9390420.1 chromosome segregation protein [Carpediemonas membranifera]